VQISHFKPFKPHLGILVPCCWLVRFGAVWCGLVVGFGGLRWDLVGFGSGLGSVHNLVPCMTNKRQGCWDLERLCCVFV